MFENEFGGVQIKIDFQLGWRHNEDMKMSQPSCKFGVIKILLDNGDISLHVSVSVFISLMLKAYLLARNLST
jgi:hypothetical protein